MKLKVKRFSDMGARRPSSGNFAEEVLIGAYESGDDGPGWYATDEMNFEIVE